ncbi:MAG: hypothetical protein ABFS45_10355 [Pseudomonadota bacterium]
MYKRVMFRCIQMVIICTISASAYAETFECTTKTHNETSDNGLLVPASNKMYIGSTFTVNVATGDWSGAPANNQTVSDRKVQIVDPGNQGMSVSIITTRGGIIGHLADLLVIKTWVKNQEKPFDYYDANFGFFTGTCVRL